MAVADGTDPRLLEMLTGAPFGLQLLGGRRALFDPVGSDPGIGIDAALDLPGWSWEHSDGGDTAALWIPGRAAPAHLVSRCRQHYVEGKPRRTMTSPLSSCSPVGTNPSRW